MSDYSIIKTCISAVNSRVQNLVHAVHYRQVGSHPTQTEPTLYFGRDIPTAAGLVHGGAVKLQRLQEHFPVSKERCNILYLVSSSQPPYVDALINLAKKRGVKVVWNQNGISYPASDPVHWKETNASMKKFIHKADYVIYQSKFCKDSADEFLGVFNGPQKIIYNCVDTNFFTPRKGARPAGPLTLLLGGNQYRRYRLETALQTVAEVKKEVPDVQLIVTGRIAWDSLSESVCYEITKKILNDLKIENNVIFAGKYVQSEAPAIYKSADMLLHPVHMDASPGMVIEAMACGLPVAYSKSGGTPELVIDSAGIGVQNDNNWETRVPPNPSLLADAVLDISKNIEVYSKNARIRAVNEYDLSKFIKDHQAAFMSLKEEG